ncbi:hypothetical protein [Coleofasciculus sp. H7-2]|uniref:hypothetical protein n=1 Tax=Coleofasciculus sp. H7-2 TaxID=3351545 RepID=UPI00366C40F9
MQMESCCDSEAPTCRFAYRFILPPGESSDVGAYAIAQLFDCLGKKVQLDYPISNSCTTTTTESARSKVLDSENTRKSDR